jgi:pre-rRNA-processing protein TSR1
MPAPVAHSHRNTTKVTHKPFKSRKASKGALKEAMKGTLFIGVAQAIF